MNEINRGRLLERFVRYAQIATTSDRALAKSQTPSTPGQWELLRLLKEELEALGVGNVFLDDFGYLVAKIPPRGIEGVPTLGFMAHVDTASDAPGEGVEPQIHRDWNGEVIVLKNGVTLDPAEIEALGDFVGDTIVTSDGMTLLGADDKAGVAEIMEAFAFLVENPAIPHGPIELIFTPDEETGYGLSRLRVDSLDSQFCFTLDGGGEGELELECYNAWEVELEFLGRPIHPGFARGKLVNAVSMASYFISLLPRSESPEATDGRYGNFWAEKIKGTIASAKVNILLRDFDKEGIQRRLDTVKTFAKACEAAFPGGRVVIKEREQYQNMKEELDKHPELEKLLERAYKEVGIVPLVKPIRGGTDGSRLTAMGIPTPNIFIGGHYFHSVREWASLGSMVKASQVIIKLIELWQKGGDKIS